MSNYVKFDASTDTLVDLEERRAAAKSKAEEEKEADDTESAEESEVKAEDEDIYVAEEGKPCTFTDIFSDTDDDEDEER